MTDQELIQQLQKEKHYLLNTLWRIAASDPAHSQFAPLVIQEAKEAAEFVEEGLL
jgi:hypothetical protein